MTDKNYVILSLFEKHGSLCLDDFRVLCSYSLEDVASSIAYLRGLKWIKLHTESDDPLLEKGVFPNTHLVLTEYGKDALHQERKRKNYYFFNAVRAWIAIGLSVLSLVVSIIALTQ